MRLRIKHRSRHQTAKMQRVIALLGMLIVLICVSILVLESLRGADEAQLSVRVLDTASIAGSRQLTLQVDNNGGRTASEVTVTAGASDETVQAVIDYVPARGNRHVIVRVPAEGEVTVAIESWIDP